MYEGMHACMYVCMCICLISSPGAAASSYGDMEESHYMHAYIHTHTHPGQLDVHGRKRLHGSQYPRPSSESSCPRDMGRRCVGRNHVIHDVCCVHVVQGSQGS
jgi:hypothetical protein